MRVKEEFLNLKEVNLYPLLMFALYRIKDIPEYMEISRLSFILEKEDLLKLCKFFGGMTISIPTLDELERTLSILLLYEYVNIEKMDFIEACNLIGISEDIRVIKTEYTKVCDILNKYDFNTVKQ